MVILSIIAAIDAKNGLGKQNKLLCHLPADLRRFKQITLGKSIIMGWNTFLSIGKPLPGRVNIVLSRQLRKHEGIYLAGSLEEALSIAKNSLHLANNSDDSNKENQEIMIIGGAHVYREVLPLVSQVYLTQIHASFDADVFFPALTKDEWECVERINHPADERNAHAMTFCRYLRRKNSCIK